jgi:hypothetical protein
VRLLLPLSPLAWERGRGEVAFAPLYVVERGRTLRVRGEVKEYT